jgi:ribosomal protein L12E/L44/L45/RPP1/RPP2
MTKDILKLLAIASISTFIIGCGSSGSSSSSNKTPVAEEQEEGEQEEPINPRACVYSVPANQILTVGDDFDPATMTATAKSGTGEDITTVIATGAEDVNTSIAGTYTVTFSSTDCDNTKATTIIVNEASDDGSTPLPF